MAIRWSLVIAASAAAFAVSWWACQEELRLDEAGALAVAGAVLAMLLAVMGWWAGREQPGGDATVGGRPVVQKVRAGRDVYVAGRDQTFNGYQRRDE